MVVVKNTLLGTVSHLVRPWLCVSSSAIHLDTAHGLESDSLCCSRVPGTRLCEAWGLLTGSGALLA